MMKQLKEDCGDEVQINERDRNIDLCFTNR